MVRFFSSLSTTKRQADARALSCSRCAGRCEYRFVGLGRAPSLAEPGQPVLETHGAEPVILARRERPIVQFCSEIASMDVGDDLARVLSRRQILPGEVIETEWFRSGQRNVAVDRNAERDVGQ